MSEIDLTFIDDALARTGRGPEATIPILQAIQSHYGWLPQEALEKVCRESQITPADIAGVSTFYSQFRHAPVGEHVISVCHGTACHVKGAGSVLDAVRRLLKLEGQQDTDPAGLFTVRKVACLGCCTLAPAVQIDDVTYGHLTPDGVGRMLRDFLELKRRPARKHQRLSSKSDGGGEIRVGLGSCCQARGSARVWDAFEQAIRQMHAPAALKRVGCVGMCHQTPLVEVATKDGGAFLYAKVNPAEAGRIVDRHFKPAGLARRAVNATSRAIDALLTDEVWTPVTRYSLNVRDEPTADFLGRQKHLATEYSGMLDPLDLDEYVARDGFKAIRNTLTNSTPDELIDAVVTSGLRGRGGAGFPTGVKWRAVQAEHDKTKYVICNGDEGDPGAFMDRMLLESFPYRVIEGMMLAAFTVGAHEGIFYIRAEYPLAVERVIFALGTCRAQGFLGKNIFGSKFDLDLRIMQGAGAFVCGEETGLIASLEGRRGMPRLRPPYPAERGLHGKPTLVNNVETLALVPWIVRNGAAAFASLGSVRSKGTKVFALAGKVARGGLIEVPMGMTLRQVIQEIGGGIAGGKKFKAVQVGGPSGGCVPAELSDVAVDYEALTGVGAMMGSGGLVVLDETDCMVDIARYFLQFTQDQSCGQCTPCRIGTRRMLEILDRIVQGHGRSDDLDELERLAHAVKAGSLCALGKTAPNPVLTTLKYFRHEYEAHLAGKCPTGKCLSLVRYVVTDDCIGCTLCAQHCPVDAIAMTPYEKHNIDVGKCVRCGTCKSVCPVDAVRVE